MVTMFFGSLLCELPVPTVSSISKCNTFHTSSLRATMRGLCLNNTNTCQKKSGIASGHQTGPFGLFSPEFYLIGDATCPSSSPTPSSAGTAPSGAFTGVGEGCAGITAHSISRCRACGQQASARWASSPLLPRSCVDANNFIGLASVDRYVL